MAGRVGVCAGQPEVKRHHSGLHAKSQKRQKKQDIHHAQTDCVTGNRLEIVGSRRPSPQGKQGKQRQRAKVCRHQIDPACPATLLQMLFGRHQKEGRQRHHFPSKQKRQGVLADDQQGHAGQYQPPEQRKLSAIAAVPTLRPVADAVEGAQTAHQKDRNQEKGAQAVHANHGAAHGGPGEDQVRGGIHAERQRAAGQPKDRAAARQPRGDALSPDASARQVQPRETAGGGKCDGDEDQGKGHLKVHLGR